MKHVSVINDIAWQTGILSLNASIEAANAGAAGKSFTVVAESVRKLADTSSQTAKQIGTMSAEMLTMSEAAGSELEQIVAQTTRTNSMVAEIIESAVQQSSGVNEINSALQEMSNMLMKNKKINTEIATISDTMKQNIDTINKMLSRFK
jgi:methyl-accepting chemotaxis protein